MRLDLGRPPQFPPLYSLGQMLVSVARYAYTCGALLLRTDVIIREPFSLSARSNNRGEDLNPRNALFRVVHIR